MYNLENYINESILQLFNVFLFLKSCWVNLGIFSVFLFDFSKSHL